ncbi:MAG: NAD(P)-binding protein [Candidatus Aenigmarchaeota archaeon]|nr:NAD(P)-binding protein [Candidatus Aenigmarchaeota archaeon]
MVKIVGAGLAGLASGIILAKNGHEVTIHDKAESVGTVVDDTQAIRNYEHDKDQLEIFREEGIEIKHAKPIYNIIKYAPSGRSMIVHSENSKPIFYALKRGKEDVSLETQLYNQAKNAGVCFHFNSREDIKTTDAEILSTGPIHNNIWAFGGIYKVDRIDPETILFFMNNDYCPKGYIYVAPYGEREVTVAATTFDIKCKLPLLFSKFLKENGVIKEILKDAQLLRYTSGYSYSNVPKTAEVNGKRLAGSIAGFLDPARGFGIKYSIWSGILAAKSIIHNKSYDKLWKSAFEKELIDGMKRRLILEKMENQDYENMILDDKVGITRYEKIPSMLRNKMLQMQIFLEMNKFRRTYDIKKYLTT